MHEKDDEPVGQVNEALEALRAHGIVASVDGLVAEAREERSLVRLPERRMAWFAHGEPGRRRLARERLVLKALERRCAFAAPRVVYETPDFDVRTMVPGDCNPWRVFATVKADPQVAARIGAAVGGILAELHTLVTAGDVAAELPRRPEWPEPAEWIHPRLAVTVQDPELRAAAREVIARYEATRDAGVLVHTDVGFHNLGIDPATMAVHGLFDFDGAAWADRHHDFRYLVYDVERYEVLDAALAVYEPIAGITIDRSRVLLYNAACALSYLAYRAGTRPEERSCGRTLDQDLAWSRHAVARALAA